MVQENHVFLYAFKWYYVLLLLPLDVLFPPLSEEEFPLVFSVLCGVLSLEKSPLL